MGGGCQGDGVTCEIESTAKPGRADCSVMNKIRRKWVSPSTLVLAGRMRRGFARTEVQAGPLAMTD